ncbi:MAG TPA: YndJ family transporter [Acidimicrobiales bacterium]|nr:YndJ family transporter [Acidimicrobiales bacterium]
MLVAAGPLVVAGLGFALAERLLLGAVPGALHVARRAHPVGAALAVAALLVDKGTVSGLLACGWLAVCLCATAGGIGVVRNVRRAAASRHTLGHLTIAVGLGYLSVGGAFLVASRFDQRPFDLSSDIVRLTSVHFHYAGFGLTVLAAAGLASVDWLASAVSLVTGCVAAMVSPPVVALGFLFDSGVGQVGGALGMTVAAWAVAFGTFLLATSSSALSPPADAPASASSRRADLERKVGRSLLVASALSPIIPMVLAVQWALAQHTGMPALSIDAMASTHGVLNAIGFVAAGLVGWLLTGLPVPSHRAPAADMPA